MAEHQAGCGQVHGVGPVGRDPREVPLSDAVVDSVRRMYGENAVDLHSYATRRVGGVLADDVVAWDLQPDDSWRRVGPLDSFEPHPQERMYRWAAEQQTVGKRTVD